MNTNTPGFVPVPGLPEVPLENLDPSYLPRGTAESAAAAARAARAAAAANVAGLGDTTNGGNAARPDSASAAVGSASVATDAEAARQAAVNDVIAALANAGANMNVPVDHRDASYIYNSESDEIVVTQAGTVSPAGAEPARIYDDNRDLQGEYNAIAASVNAIQAKLDASHFNKETGERVFDLTGEARAIVERQLVTARASAALAVDVLQRLHVQRANAEAKAGALSSEQIARVAFSNGNKEKAALLDRMIEEEAARELARSLIRARAAGRG